LIALEPSHAAALALQFALDLTRARDFEVYLLVVGDRRRKKRGEHEGDALKARLDNALASIDEMLMRALVALAQRGTQLNLKRVGKIHKRFVVGDAATEVLKLAAELTSEVIVMGVPSPQDPDGGVTEFDFTANCAAAVVKRAPCTVHAIKTVDPMFVMV
jgi:nucleotide-binding universal stress UspA family protein